MTPIILALGLAALLDSAEPFPTGVVVEHVACGTDPTQTYALYLPSSYTTERQWPALILMDPRGRALAPIDLFREAAERRGYILMSSYDTSSDGPWEPNEKAIRAMLPEAQQRFAVDTHRVYLAGFSGTARVGWDFGLRLKGHVAGLIGFGGGLPFDPGKLQSVPFAFFGGAGRHDFNYEEMRALDEKLEAMHAPHRFEPYDGPHSWGTQAVCAEAIDWMEVQAMKGGLRPKSAALTEEIFSAWQGAARSLEATGDPFGAFLAYRALARDFEGLRDVGVAAQRAAELEGTKPVRRILERQRILAQRQTAYEGRLSTFLRNFHAAPEPPPLGRCLIDLQLASLKRRAAVTNDPLDADAAQRLLEMVFVQASFYEPRQFIDQSDPARALAILLVAAEIKPDDPRVFLGQARAYARGGQKDKAIDALRRAVDRGVTNPAILEGDDVFDALKGEAGYREILERMRAQDPSKR